MKKLKYSLVCCSLLSVMGSNAIELKEGWNLVSLENDFNVSSLNSNIKSVWSYDQNWSAYSSDAEYLELIKSNNITILNNVKPSQGIWIQANIDLIQEVSSKAIVNDINISKGWNLIGTIEDTTSLNSIDSNAIYWKYDENWTLGSNTLPNAYPHRFTNINKNDGVWVLSDINITYQEDMQKKFLFLDNNLVPQRTSYNNTNSSLDGFVHTNPNTDFIFKNDGYIDFNASFENNEIVSEYVSGEFENYAIFLENSTGYATFENNNSDPLSVTDFSLNDYFLKFYDIESIFIEAKPIKPLLISSDVIMTLSNVDMKQSLTLSFETISDPGVFSDIGVFVKGISTKVQGSDKETIDPLTINGQMNLKPTFTNVLNITNPYIYGKNGSKWDLVGPGLKVGTSVKSKNWYNKFTSFALVDADNSNMYQYNKTVRNTQNQTLRDVLIVSDNKIAVSTTYDGNFTYTAPSVPSKLIAYKQGYKPKLIDLNSSSDIILEPLDGLETIVGLNSKFDKDFNIIYTVGAKDKEFTYLNTDYTIKPKLLANTDKTIYSSVYSYEDGYVFGASDSTVLKVYESHNLEEKLNEGFGLIYDSLIVENSEDIYYGTFGDSFTKINSSDTTSDEEIGYTSTVDIDTYLSVVFKPIISNDKIYIPVFNQDINNTVSMIIKDINDIESTLQPISNIGTPGKLSQAVDSIIFGTSDSKVVFINKEDNNVSNIVDFNGSGIIAKVIEFDNSYYAIDLNGLLKNIDTNDSKQLTTSSTLLTNGTELIAIDHNGTINYLDASLNILKTDMIDDNIIAEPVIFEDNIYIITASGKFYKNSTLIGTFNTKVTNMNLENNNIIFGAENGTVWNIEIL
ncbi:MAG: hypothetical protein U9N59_06060 [Campylobacterota bacterium]|nr:hypothetical protein [Campylobacterota bacterium]